MRISSPVIMTFVDYFCDYGFCWGFVELLLERFVALGLSLKPFEFVLFMVLALVVDLGSVELALYWNELRFYMPLKLFGFELLLLCYPWTYFC